MVSVNYLALGDSISIDDYTGQTGGGAASQFARLTGALRVADLTRDGCTTAGVLVLLDDRVLLRRELRLGGHEQKRRLADDRERPRAGPRLPEERGDGERSRGDHVHDWTTISPRSQDEHDGDDDDEHHDRDHEKPDEPA